MSQNVKGKIYVVATPIGNLKDITLRALEVLKEVDLIACEDTRHTKKLLTHYDIDTKVLSYHEHNEIKRTQEILSFLEEGRNIAIVSDAGTPLVSDPGYKVVSEAIKQGFEVTSIPGATAFVSALILSGMESERFTFCGFLERKSKKRCEQLEVLKDRPETLIFYEAPHRILETLTDAEKILGDRKCVVAKELTKLHESALRGNISEVLASLSAEEIRGEFVILLEGSSKDSLSDTIKKEHVNKYAQYSKVQNNEK